MTAIDSPGVDPAQAGSPDSKPRWRIPERQRFVFADFDDGIVMFDARVGATHLLSASAAETLAIVQDIPGLTADEIHQTLLERLQLDENVLLFASVLELLWHLENLGLVATCRQ